MGREQEERLVNGKPVTVLVADHEERTRRGVAALLETCPDIEVVGQAVDGRAALRMIEALRPTVALLELQLPLVDGIEATSRIKRRWPEVVVLVMSMHSGSEGQAGRMGADGFLLKACRPEKLIAAVLERSRRGLPPDREADPERCCEVRKGGGDA